MILSEFNVDTLVSLSLAGNDGAYGELVRRYQRAVIGSAYKILRDFALAEDAAQDAFVSAWMCLDKLRDASRFGAWVCRISKNRAVNIASKYRDYIDFDTLSNVMSDADDFPEEIILGIEEKAELRLLVDALPEKIRTVIHLHYYEGLSIAEIAYRLNIPDGTVKWRLSDGRRRIGKEFGVMTDKEKAFIKSVLAKVEELKLWRFRGSKDGFEEKYREVLADIDKMPECNEKYHALADTLQLGYWWVPGEKNDEVLARIREAAERSHNEEVMEMIFHRDNDKLSGKELIEYIRDKQIPYLQAEGYKNTLGCAWFWLGCAYHRAAEIENARNAFKETMRVSEKNYVYYANAISCLRALDFDAPEKKMMYETKEYSEEYRYIDGKLRFWSQPGYSEGYMSYKHHAHYIFHSASRCDRVFFDETLAVGESVTDSDGATLTFVSDNETVETPCGVFEGCQLWRCVFTQYSGIKNGQTSDTYYKSGVGIVKQVGHGEFDYEQTLCAYSVKGEGLLPFAKGNRWEYRLADIPKYMEYENICECAYADDKKVTMAMYVGMKRTGYDEDDFDEMMCAITDGYRVEGKDEIWHLADVSQYIKRAKELAKTPYEKTLIAGVQSFMQRAYDTEEEFSPNRTASGHGNGFDTARIFIEDNKPKLHVEYDYFFWSGDYGEFNGDNAPLLHKDIYGILMDNAGCMWSDEWVVGADIHIDEERRHGPIKSHITVTDAGTVTTAAGTFEGCICVTLDTDMLGGLWGYRKGKRDYIFAPNVGIVRTVRYFGDSDSTAVYELTAYEGTGEGMFPYGEGFMRRYDALNLQNGYEASAVYTYAEKDGEMIVFSDRTGVKKL